MGIDATAATRHLMEVDPVMARLIAQCGPFEMAASETGPFRALARSIVFQQLSGKAASTIFGRFAALFELPPGADFVEPAAVLAASDEAMRSAGLSRQKTAALRSLAEHFVSGELGEEPFHALGDEAIIERLTRVRGIGRWSAEMFLMFHLHRPDVLPVNDLGINRAIQKEYGLDAAPKPADVLRIGAPWRPWATVACWYLWRSGDVRVPGAE